MALKLFSGTYRDRRVLVTGHTGFKGSWLALWLDRLGAHIHAASLPPPTTPSHWDLLRLRVTEHHIDIRNAREVSAAIGEARPDIVFHLAAQSLVQQSYRDPLETWSTNVMGTANVLDACRHHGCVRAIVIATTDKCYENLETDRRYREDDRLGGHDAYSASKAAAELVASSYRSAFFHDHDAPLVATARAGNVIGGGDWADDRLIPDLVRAVGAGTPLDVRAPSSTRPWQHVLDCLSGYLQLGERLLARSPAFARAWNFGPDEQREFTVAEVLDRMREFWPRIQWRAAGGSLGHEARRLRLDNGDARTLLGWKPVYGLSTALEATAAWYRDFVESQRVTSVEQLAAYVEAASRAKPAWVSS